MARSSTCCSPRAVTWRLPGGSSAGPCGRVRSRPRSPPTGPRAYPRVLDELILSALHVTERYANNRVEADHGRLKARLRPMRGLKRDRSARILLPGPRSCRTSAAATTNSPPASPPATASAWLSTSSRWPSERLTASVIAFCHMHRSPNATLPPLGRPSWPSHAIGCARPPDTASPHLGLAPTRRTGARR